MYIPNWQNPVIEAIDTSQLKANFGVEAASLSVLRLDQCHPVLSGNKWFKLKAYLKAAEDQSIRHFVSFGGAYSNHLHALAYACHLRQFELDIYVRGEAPKRLSPTLHDCQKWGAQLHWVPRSEYRALAQYPVSSDLVSKYPDAMIVPEGGEGELGLNGMVDLFSSLCMAASDFDVIVCPVGTGTTLAGIALGVATARAARQPKLIGISALKGAKDLENRVKAMLASRIESLSEEHAITAWQISHDYHFGGFAKRSDALLRFTDAVSKNLNLPLDYIYTAKAFYGLQKLCQKGLVFEHESVLFVHTGGLQGNRT